MWTNNTLEGLRLSAALRHDGNALREQHIFSLVSFDYTVSIAALRLHVTSFHFTFIETTFLMILLIKHQVLCLFVFKECISMLSVGSVVKST